MGMKVSTLALCSVTGRKVKVHATKEKARVIVAWENNKPVYSLRFDDGRIENVVWSQDMQGHTVKGSDLEEDEESDEPAALAV